METVVTQYINHKIKSIQLLSRELSHTKVPYIATGSWNEEVNVISIWQYSDHQDFDMSSESSKSSNPLMQKVTSRHQGDVSALHALTAQKKDYLISASSLGNVHCFQIQKNPELAIQLTTSWDVSNGNLTSLDGDAASQSVVASSENGKVFLCSLGNEKLTDELQVNSNSIFAVRFLNSNRIFATVGASGLHRLKIWDIQHSRTFPSEEYATNSHGQDIYTCMELHPTRPELLFVGTAKGHIIVWDRRYPGEPVLDRCVHKQAVRDIKLHSERQQHLYSCSDDGGILGYDFHQGKSSRDIIEYNAAETLHVEAIHQTALPWNSLACDSYSNTLVAGSDNDTLLVAPI